MQINILHIFNKLITFMKTIWVLKHFMDHTVSSSNYEPFTYFKTLDVVDYVFFVFNVEYLHLMYGKHFLGSRLWVMLLSTLFQW